MYNIENLGGKTYLTPEGVAHRQRQFEEFLLRETRATVTHLPHRDLVIITLPDKTELTSVPGSIYSHILGHLQAQGLIKSTGQPPLVIASGAIILVSYDGRYGGGWQARLHQSADFSTGDMALALSVSAERIAQLELSQANQPSPPTVAASVGAGAGAVKKLIGKK